MDIQKEREAFELNVNPVTWERIEYNAENNIYMAKSKYWTSTIVQAVANEIDFGWKMWQLAKAQVVPDTYTPIVLALEDVQSKIAKTSFLTMDEENENEVMAVNANELAAYIDELIEVQEQSHDS